MLRHRDATFNFRSGRFFDRDFSISIGKFDVSIGHFDVSIGNFDVSIGNLRFRSEIWRVLNISLRLKYRKFVKHHKFAKFMKRN